MLLRLLSQRTLERRKHTQFPHRRYKNFLNFMSCCSRSAAGPLYNVAAPPLSTHCLPRSPLPPPPNLPCHTPPRIRFRLPRLIQKQDFDLQDVRFDFENLYGNTSSTSKMWDSTFMQWPISRYLLRKTSTPTKNSTLDLQFHIINAKWVSEGEIHVFCRRCGQSGFWLQVEI